jgi:PleD family two-component response regulator
MRPVVRPSGDVDSHNGNRQARQIRIKSNRPFHARLAKLRPIAKAAAVRKEYRVLVVDDSVLPRAAARTMLGTASGLRLVGEASSGVEAVQAMGRLKADLV